MVLGVFRMMPNAYNDYPCHESSWPWQRSIENQINLTKFYISFCIISQPYCLLNSKRHSWNVTNTVPLTVFITRLSCAQLCRCKKLFWSDLYFLLYIKRHSWFWVANMSLYLSLLSTLFVKKLLSCSCFKENEKVVLSFVALI